MSIMTIETTITRKYLFGKSKSDLAYMYLELLERAVQAEAERDALVIEREQLLKRAEQAERFRAAFAEWILRQSEEVKFSAAMSFGQEYLDGAK